MAKSETIKQKEHTVYREPGSAIEGDKILFQCRKDPKYQKSRGSSAHHYYCGYLAMNAYAVIDRTFKTIRDL